MRERRFGDRHALRVEAYALLIHDQFPSFSLASEMHEQRLATQS